MLYPAHRPAKLHEGEARSKAMDYMESCDPNCLFCRWIREGTAVARFGSVAAFNDGFPVTDGHLLIVPLRHTADWLCLTRQEIGDSETLIRTLIKNIRQRDPLVTGFNIGTNIGASAGQTVFHAHIHLIPRRDGDTQNPKGGVRGVIDGKRGYDPSAKQSDGPIL
jgi:ATP adenylyltransferase